MDEEEWDRQARELMGKAGSPPAAAEPAIPPAIQPPPLPTEDPARERERLRYEAASPAEQAWMEQMEKRARAEGQGHALIPPSPFRSLGNRAIEAGIGTRGVSAAARLNIGLALGAARNPNEQLSIIKRAIENDTGREVETRIGPLDEVEWRFRGDQQWDLVNGAGIGSAVRDIVGSIPEIATIGAGVAGGVSGAVLGSKLPVRGAVPGGDIIGSGLAEAVAHYFSLEMARRQGTIDWSDERLELEALQRGGLTAAGTGAARGGLAAFRRIIDWARGSPSLAADLFTRGAPGGSSAASSIEGGLITADELQGRSTALTGLPFPMTAGQTAAAPALAATQAGRITPPEALPPGAGEALLAEEAARRVGGPGQPVRDVLSQQAAALDAADFAVFAANDPTARTAAGRAIQGAMNAILYRRRTRAEAEVARLRGEADASAERVTLMSQAAGLDLSTAELANVTRNVLTQARADVFAPFSQAYDNLQRTTGFEINLAPFRDSAQRIRTDFGQGILDSISIRGQDNIVADARRAGIEVVGTIGNVQLLMDRPATLGQVMQTIEDINEQLRKPTIVALPRAEAIFRRLRDGLLEAVETSAGPGVRGQIDALRTAYARSIEQFDTGIVGQLLQRDRFDNYVISGDDAANMLVRDPSTTRAFVNALFTRQEIDPATGQRMVTELPGGRQALRAAQDAVLARIVRDFRDYQTGQWNQPALATYLQANQEALDMLFVRGPRLARDANPGLNSNIHERPFALEQVNAVRSWTNAADRMDQRQRAALQLFSDRFGVFTHDPSVMVQTLVTEGRVTDLRLAERMVTRVYGPDGQARFRAGLANQARQLMTGADGLLTPQKIDAFLENQSGRTVAAMLGPQFARNLTTIRDMLRVMEVSGRGSATDIAREFGFGVPALRGWLRFARVLFPPLTAAGRGLTATVGLANEQTQKQLGQLLADPSRLAEFIRVSERVRDPFSSSARAQLVRVGFGHIPQMWDGLRRTYGAAADALLEDQPTPPEGYRP